MTLEKTSAELKQERKAKVKRFSSKPSGGTPLPKSRKAWRERRKSMSFRQISLPPPKKTA